MIGRNDFKLPIVALLLFPFDMIDKDYWIMECLGYRNVLNFFARFALILFAAAAFKINFHERQSSLVHAMICAEKCITKTHY